MQNTLELIATLIEAREAGPSTGQIARALKLAIDQGTLLPGTTLPSARELAKKLGVSRSTAHRSFQTLSSQGYIKASTGQASRVQNPILKSRNQTVPSDRSTFDCSPELQVGETAIVQSVSLNNDVLNLNDAAVATRIRLLLSEHFRDVYIGEYNASAVNLRLRQALSDYLFRSRLVSSTKYDIEILSCQATRIELLMALLADAGATIAVADDADEGLIQRLRLHGLRVLIVESDGNGMRTELLGLGEEAPHLVYVTPSRGALLSVDRRKHLCEWVSRTGSLIVEDDCESFKSSGVESLPAVHSFSANGRVLYLPAPPAGFIPFLRVCAVVLPLALTQPFLRLKTLVDPHPPCLEQQIFCDLLESGQFETLLMKNRAIQFRAPNVSNDSFVPGDAQGVQSIHESTVIATPHEANPVAGYAHT